MLNMVEDKRRHQRYNVSWDRACSLEYLDSHDSSTPVRVQDISRSGIKITSDRPLREGQQQDFILKASWIKRQILVKLNIAWKSFIIPSSFVYGANFLSISPQDIFELQDTLYSDWLKDVLTVNR